MSDNAVATTEPWMPDAPTGTVVEVSSQDVVEVSSQDVVEVSSQDVVEAAPQGSDDISNVPVIEFAAGLVGFPQARHFVLVRADDVAEPVWYVLRCLEHPTLRFLVAQPALVFPDYAPEIDDATAEKLGLDAETADDAALLLVVVTLGQKDEDATANLFAPLVLNRTTLQGAQAVLSGSGWSLREPLYSQG